MEPLDDDKVVMTAKELASMADLMEEALNQIIKLRDAAEAEQRRANQWKARAQKMAEAWQTGSNELETHATNILLWLWSEAVAAEDNTSNEPEEGQ